MIWSIIGLSFNIGLVVVIGRLFWERKKCPFNQWWTQMCMIHSIMVSEWCALLMHIHKPIYATGQVWIGTFVWSFIWLLIYLFFSSLAQFFLSSFNRCNVTVLNVFVQVGKPQSIIIHQLKWIDNFDVSVCIHRQIDAAHL